MCSYVRLPQLGVKVCGNGVGNHSRRQDQHTKARRRIKTPTQDTESRHQVKTHIQDTKLKTRRRRHMHGWVQKPTCTQTLLGNRSEGGREGVRKTWGRGRADHAHTHAFNTQPREENTCNARTEITCKTPRTHRHVGLGGTVRC